MSDTQFILLFVLTGVIAVGWIGVRSGKAASKTLDGWIVNDRKMGPVLTWFLLGTEIYTAFTFLGIAGFAFSNGGGIFYTVAHNDIAFALGFFVLPAIGLLGRKFGYVTQPDFVAGRYQSKWLGVVIAFSGAIIMIAYVDLNIRALGAILGVMTNYKLSEIVAEVIGFSVLSLAVLMGGIRGSAWQSVIKDILMFGSIGAIFLMVPYSYFGGFEAMFHRMMTEVPERIVMPGPNPQYGLSWFWTTVLLHALGQWMWPHFFNVAFSARDTRTLKLQAVFMPIYQLVKIAVVVVGFAAILIFANQDVSGNQVMLLMAKEIFPTWMLAIFTLAAVLAAIVPAGPIIMTSCILLSRNVYAVLRPGSSDRSLFWLARSLVLMVTGIALILTVTVHSLIVSVLLAAYSFIAQLIPGVMIGGLFWRRATATGVAAGLAVGWGTMIVLLATGNDPIWGLNAGFVALALNCAAFWLVSLMTKPASAAFLDSYFSTIHPRKDDALREPAQ